MGEEVDFPCLICGENVASSSPDDSVTLNKSSFVDLRAKVGFGSTKKKKNDDKIFLCFLKLFKVEDFEESNESKDCNDVGDEGPPFRFCGTCKNQIGKLLELQVILDELKKKIRIGTEQLKGKMERSEETFESEEIYDCYPRYRNVRSKIIDKVAMVIDQSKRTFKSSPLQPKPEMDWSPSPSSTSELDDLGNSEDESENESEEDESEERPRKNRKYNFFQDPLNQPNLTPKSSPLQPKPEVDCSPPLTPDLIDLGNSEDEDESEERPRKNQKVKYVEDKTNKMLTYMDTYTFHLLESSDEKVDREVKCTLCDLIIPYKKPWIRRHVDKVHTDKFLCPHCSWRFPTAPRLRAHVQGVHEGQPKNRKMIECSICRKPILSGTQKRHEWGHKSKQEKEEAFKDPTLAAEIPKRLLHAEKKYQCDKCEQKFTQLNRLKKHQERKHKDPSERRELCPDCGKTFLNLRTHQSLQHPKDNDGVVDLMKTCLEPGCGKRFGNLGDLTRHKNQVHRKLKPFQCNQCGKCFGAKYNLKQHVKTMHKK